METFNIVGKVSIGILAGAMIVHVYICERSNFSFVLLVISKFTGRLLLEVCLVLALVTALILGLSQIPSLEFLNYGWSNLVFDGGGNILIRPLIEGVTNASALLRIFLSIALLSVVVILPFLAKYEEEYFRRGRHTWQSIITQSIKFGIMHCVCGVSILVGIVLIIPGIYFGYKYKKTYDECLSHMPKEQAEGVAVTSSVSSHTLYNYVAVALLTLFLILEYIGIRP
jgi:hypothetical protein